jgi:cytochrome c oxidase subunit II
MLNFLGMPEPMSAHAGDVDSLISIIHWLMFVLFVGWGAFFAFVLFRFRKSANPVASYEGTHGTASKYLEIGIVVFEAFLLVAYAIPAWAKRVGTFPSDSEAVVVRVIAEQFAWNVHYPGKDGIFGKTDLALVASENPIGLDRRDEAAKDDITTINQLTVPADRPVLVRLSSKDVIHSFGVYELRVKQDAVPGLQIPVWFTAVPEAVGKQFEIVCSQLCGLGHYRMRGFINVKNAAEYQAFLDEEARNLAPAR